MNDPRHFDLPARFGGVGTDDPAPVVAQASGVCAFSPFAGQIERQWICVCDMGPQGESTSAQGDVPASLEARLFRACVEGDVTAARQALDLGANINARDEVGRTPAMIACLKGHRETLKALMCAGFDMGALDRQGRDISHYLNVFGSENSLQLAQNAAAHSYLMIKSIQQAAQKQS